MRVGVSGAQGRWRRPLGIFSALNSPGFLLNGSVPSARRGSHRLSSSAPVHCRPNLLARGLRYELVCYSGCRETTRKEVWETPGHLCCPLTSLLRHPRAPNSHSMSSPFQGRSPWLRIVQIWRRQNHLGTTQEVDRGWRDGPLAPSQAATLAAKVMSAALTYVRSFLGCCRSCAGAQWPRSARGGGALEASFPGDFRAPLPHSPAQPPSGPCPPACSLPLPLLLRKTL